MAIAPGSRVGPYEVTAPLGEGGMGVVFRGRDVRPAAGRRAETAAGPLADDPDRLSRFRREAQSWRR